MPDYSVPPTSTTEIQADVVVPVKSAPWKRLLAVIGVLTASLYAWTADFPLVYDDCYYMSENPLFLASRGFPHLDDFQEFATRPQRTHADPDLATNVIMRPVAYATLHLNHALDGFNPRWYRVINILIHAANGLLIFALLRQLQQRVTTSLFIPAGAALLFIVHPLATESVTYVIQRFTSLSTTFYLLTLYLHLAACGTAPGWRRWLLGAGAVVCVLTGMLTKEDVFTAPLMALLLHWLALGAPLRVAARRAVPLLLCMPLIPALVMLTVWAQSGTLSLSAGMNIVNFRIEPWDQWTYLVTQITVVTDYARQILWPTGLNVMPDWPVYHSLLHLPVLGSLLILVVIIGMVVWAFRRHSEDVRTRLCLVFTLWFFITVSISSSLIPLPDLKADHRTYLPSIGLLVLVMCLLDWLRSACARLRLHIPVSESLVVAAVLTLAACTCLRNEYWRSNVALWEETLTRSPEKFGAWVNLGAAYSESRRHEKAIKCYQRAIELNPNYPGAQTNLIHSLASLQRWQECLDVGLPLLESVPTLRENKPVMYHLSLAMAGLGRMDEAERILTKLAVESPNDFLTRKVLGMVYTCKNKLHEAMIHLQAAQHLNPQDQELGQLMAKIETRMGGRSTPSDSAGE